MSIESVESNIMKDPGDIVVNPVNCIGVAGRGLALAFRERYRDWYLAYKDACNKKLLRPGWLHVWERPTEISEMCCEDLTKPRFPSTFIDFPTKCHWRDPSRIEYIENGLLALRGFLQGRGRVTVNVPSLGVGNGGLDWGEVKPLIVSHLSGLVAEIRLYEPYN